VGNGESVGVGMSLHQREREIQSRFIQHVSTMGKESSSGMIRINTTLTLNEQQVTCVATARLTLD
jgi:hypothetical protein